MRDPLEHPASEYAGWVRTSTPRSGPARDRPGRADGARVRAAHGLPVACGRVATRPGRHVRRPDRRRPRDADPARERRLRRRPVRNPSGRPRTRPVRRGRCHARHPCGYLGRRGRDRRQRPASGRIRHGRSLRRSGLRDRRSRGQREHPGHRCPAPTRSPEGVTRLARDGVSSSSEPGSHLRARSSISSRAPSKAHGCGLDRHAFTRASTSTSASAASQATKGMLGMW